MAGVHPDVPVWRVPVVTAELSWCHPSPFQGTKRGAPFGAPRVPSLSDYLTNFFVLYFTIHSAASSRVMTR